MSLLLAQAIGGAQGPLSPSPAANPTQEIDRLLGESAAAYKAHRETRGRELAEAALALATRHALPLYEAEALIRLGKDDAWFRRYELAREKFERARVLFQQAGERGREAVAEMHIGVTLTSLGETARGLALVQQARATFRARGDARSLAEAGEQLMFLMDASPEKDRLRAEVFADVRAAALRVTECNIQQEWGDELFMSGRYAEAYARLTEALHCFEQTDDLGRTGRTLVSLGRVERVHGQLEKALDNYTRALALQDRAHDVAAAVQSLNAIAVTFAMLGRRAEAEERYVEAIARARESTPHLVNILSGNLGGLYLDWGRYRKAAELLAPSRAQEKDEWMYGVRTRQLAWAYHKLRRFTEAAALADEAVTLAGSLPEERLRALKVRADIMRERGQLDRARADLAESMRLTDDLRRHTLPADIMRRGFGETTQLLSDMTIDVLVASRDGRAALAASEQARSRAFLDRLAARAARTEAAAATTMSAPTAAPASVTDIQALASRLRSTWLMFWVGQTSTIVWVVQPSGAVHWRRVPIPAAELETLVAQSVPQGGGLDALAAMSLASRAHVRPWRELYRRLLLPVSAYLPQTAGSRLTIVPHGPLFRLSFAALQDEHGRYLLERYDLHYVPAAGVLQFTAAENRHASTRTDGALLVGDPAANTTPLTPAPTAAAGLAVRGATPQLPTSGGGASRNRALPSLGWARREVLSILKLLPQQSVALIGSDATETAVREHMDGRRIIHFATHGVVYSDAAINSSYLAVSSGRDRADPAADGRLTADEIDQLTLDADLVVLSACGTALGPISGDGVQGFTRAFLAAGADSVIATTWSVADRTSYQVMERFYRGWLAGRSKSRALRQAQLALLQQLRAGGVTIDGVVLHESPWLWAGFVLVGNP